MTINHSDLSIVIQGPTFVNDVNVMLEALRSAKKIFPDAELICSTWFGLECSELERYSNHVVYSQDPGGFKDDKGYLNVNRQIISSLAGVEKATRKYTLKVRSDIKFINQNVLKEYNRTLCRSNAKNAENYPILVTNLTSVNPVRGRQLFALCDWVYFGTTQKLMRLFSTPLFPVSYFRIKKHGSYVQRYNAEQWLIINYLDEKYDVLSWFTDGYVFGDDKLKLAKAIYTKEFVMVSFLKLGMRSRKYKLTFFELSKMFTQKEWESQINGRSFIFDIERILYQLMSFTTIRKYVKKITNFNK